MGRRLATMSSRIPTLTILSVSLALVLAGCATQPLAEEDAARDRLTETRDAVDGAREAVSLEALGPDSPPADFLHFALLYHPAVEAAFQDWRASVSDIVTARSQPDPRLTFEADITDTLMTFMPGVMFDIMNNGTRKAMGREATAASDIAYRKYLAELQSTAAEVSRAWIDLAFANEAVGLHAAMLEALEEAAELAATEYVTNRGSASLDTQVRLRNEAGMHHAEHHATVDLREATRLRFKAALGLSPDEPNPPWPASKLERTPLPDRDMLWGRIIANNPDLAVMRSMVEQSVAAEATADRSGSPNFSIGAMVDLKASPLMFRPTGSMSLPIWREKIDAQFEAARARHEAAMARVSAQQLTLAAQLAQAFFLVQDADRIIAYIDNVALPNLSTVSQTAEAGLQSGTAGATAIAETEAAELAMKVRRLDMLHQRELAVTDLFILTGNAAPADSPQLSANTP